MAGKKAIKNKYGQYFTPKDIAEFMVDLSTKDKSCSVLEPSCGKGIFIDVLLEKGFNNISAFEIDTTLESLHKDIVEYNSFISSDINQKFDLIIGNPPYIKWANLEQELKQELKANKLWNKYFNSLSDYLSIFILKSIEQLNYKGELIFICSDYWLKTSNSLSLRNYMMQNGVFEEIFHFKEANIFNNASTSLIIFKYKKAFNAEYDNNIILHSYSSTKKPTKNILNNLKTGVNDEITDTIKIPQFKVNKNWLLTSENKKKEIEKLQIYCKKDSYNLFDIDDTYYTIGDFFDIGNGLVSGLDKAFQYKNDTTILNNEEKKAIIKVVKAKDLNPFDYNSLTNYIFINQPFDERTFKQCYPNFYNQLSQYKSLLINRYQYNREINFWEFVFPRNYNLFKKKERKIFVPCKERISNKNYFRFALIDEDIFPTQDVTGIYKKKNCKESIEYITAYLNNPLIFDWLNHNGIAKGAIIEFSEKPLASIPYKPINWENNIEIEMHNEITILVNQYIRTKDSKITRIINDIFSQLLSNK
jgi:adenine-specific DNA-methyltransferase